MALAVVSGVPVAYGQEHAVQGRRTLAELAIGGQVALSLEDAIEIALANNLDIELQRLGPRLADTDVLRASAGGGLRGATLGVREGPRGGAAASDLLFPSVGFGSEVGLGIGTATSGAGRPPPSQDPVLFASLRRSELNQPQPNSFSAGTSRLSTDNTSLLVGLQQGFITGGDLIVTFDGGRSGHNNRRFDLNPYFATSVSVSVVQPLLRGFGPAVNRRLLLVARNNRHVSELVFEQQVVTTAASVVRLYWDLVSLIEEVEVRRQALERSARLLADTEVHADVGTRAPIDVVRARAEVARSQRDLISSEGLARQQELLLRDYLSADSLGSPGLTPLRLVPVDRPEADTSDPPTADALVDFALSRRPDVAQARLQLDNTRLLLVGSKNNLLPSLDAIAAFHSNGLAGTVNPLTLEGAPPHSATPDLIGGFGSAARQVVDGRFPDYVVGLQLTVPLRNRAAEADHARDLLVLRQQEVRMQQIEKQVRVEIESALVALEQARATVAAARLEREYQEQALAAEADRLDVGASTMYQVIQYQRDLTQARSAEMNALAAQAKATAALARASGQLLARFGIVAGGALDDRGPTRAPF